MRALGQRGMVSSPHYLATASGVNALRRGGSALDAAIATNATLAVVMPYACGIGGDIFALIYDADEGTLTGLNGSGRAPAEATPEAVLRLAGSKEMPVRGPLSITVPGCVEGWGRLHERYGRLPLGELLADAIHYAEAGVPLSARYAAAIRRFESILHPGTPARETYLPNGTLPSEGDVLRQPLLAQTLRTVADEGPDAYYQGAIAEEIARAVREAGGLLSARDLAEHRSDWVHPLSTEYRELTVYELPPNSQGIVALSMLQMLRFLPKESISGPGDAYVHTLAEVARYAYADRTRYLTDPGHMSVQPATLLEEERARERASAMRQQVAAPALAGEPADTIYLCTADRHGNLVSLIESNYAGIGSGVMAGQTGVMLQNRGAWFSLEPGHANIIAPRKRTMHTLMPAMAFRGDEPWLVFGTEGGSAQPQIHVQNLTKIVDWGLPLDEALAAPRFDAVVGAEDGRPAIELEAGFGPEMAEALQRRGHAVRISPATIGTSQAIRVLPDGVYVGASDPRAESLALGF